MTEPSLDRREVLGALFPDPGEYLMVAGLAGSARDAAALTDEADYLFAFGGAMGGAVPMGLGMALAAPDRKVAVITGDGELLMNAGALASVASAMPEEPLHRLHRQRPPRRDRRTARPHRAAHRPRQAREKARGCRRR